MSHHTTRHPGVGLNSPHNLGRFVRAAASIIGFLGAIGALGMTPAAFGQAGSGTVTGHGLTVKADWWGISSAGGGYCPVRFEVTNTTASARRLKFELDSATYPRDLEVSQTIEVDANTKVAFTMSLPVVSYNMWARLRVYERGRELDKLAIMSVGGTNWWGGQTIPAMLLIDSSAPDMQFITEAASRVSTGQAATQPGVQPIIVTPKNAPTKWVDYSMIDLIMIKATQLDQLSTESRDAIAAWTIAGGNLFVYGVQDDRENSPVIKRLLDLDNRGPRDAEWRQPRDEDRNSVLISSTQSSFVYTGRGSRRVVRMPVAQQTGTTPVSTEASDPKINFSIRQFGLGQLLVSSSAEPFPGVVDDWAWVLKTVGQARLFWSERHGISARAENQEFWYFLIPGVGRAPVIGFQVLIALFVFVIGPVNYFVLRRNNRLYFMIVTVPAVALATTTLLLGYAMTSDGFSLRTRVRSVTMLDQRRREAVSWSRNSYYAGIAPAGGLRFSRDTAVYPIQGTGNAAGNRVVDWTDDQHMSSGWLRSRTPTQLMTVSYLQTEEQLEFASDVTGALRVTNNLGINIHALLVMGDDGAIYSGLEIARGVSTKIGAAELADAHKEIARLIAEQKLELPQEMQDRDPTSGLFGPRRSWMWNQYAPAQSSNSVLETLIHVIGGDPKDLRAFLGPRSYIAIVDRPPMVELGAQKTEDRGSLYVIWGMY